ncbi:hypothetical protein BCR32DRAFT_293142 [Anaeromyces robustus]|uniref:Uncharacterized protein n=1 Tax=Anaeromyces robustus TaxID=1754192 RepID=A0A1Y1X7I1_9FUNG|nr:hypothetical protein BCR32DRAFT_293142 [Anaeromyces robustus]|eukprot:ORX81692.1 hypothetical protein BCR32DRAFT_293142 [Anaeromyces robustus]
MSNNAMNAKQACPRCQGAGFIHINDEVKHDKARNAKCKNCKNCTTCQGTGTIVGKMPCPTCNVKGWLHDSVHPHDTSDNIRCFYCRTCPDCKETGVVDINFKKSTNTNTKQTNNTSKHSKSKPSKQMSVSSIDQKPIPTTPVENHLRGSCPVCSALGFVHESHIPHDKPSGKPCKYCSVCRVCAGAGIIVGKQACTHCSAKGWYHPPNSKFVHNVTPSTMRCFHCKDCPVCNGYGVIDPTKSKENYRNSIISQKTDHSLYSPPSKETINVQLTPPTHKNYQLSTQQYQKMLEKEQEKQQEQLLAQEHLQQRLEQTQAIQLMEQQMVQQQKLQQEQQIKQIQMQQMQQLQLQQQMQMQQMQMQQMQLYQLQQPVMYMPYTTTYATAPAVTPVMPYGYAAQAQSVCSSCQGLGFKHKKKSSKPHNQPANVRCDNCRDCKTCHGTGYVSL